VAGAVIGGPNIVTHPRHCWNDRYGYRHCSRR
jgi:hypothetical protein